MEEWIAIYKGLRLPLLGMILIFIAIYVFRPRAKSDLESARFDMLDDDIDQDLSKEFRKKNGEAS